MQSQVTEWEIVAAPSLSMSLRSRQWCQYVVEVVLPAMVVVVVAVVDQMVLKNNQLGLESHSPKHSKTHRYWLTLSFSHSLARSLAYSHTRSVSFSFARLLALSLSHRESGVKELLQSTR